MSIQTMSNSPLPLTATTPSALSLRQSNMEYLIAPFQTTVLVTVSPVRQIGGRQPRQCLAICTYSRDQPGHQLGYSARPLPHWVRLWAPHDSDREPVPTPTTPPPASSAKTKQSQKRAGLMSKSAGSSRESPKSRQTINPRTFI